ncbi:glycoside hydrolase family 3 protein [Bacillus sp. ISL-41]|uniref:glycoside hydrolase family 3 protein n=1 Tax=Bacillus sp. ISL-41 TaxID=2819127 RepID=UPI0020359F19|nr:glycoside hydrolase family 3 protein [Bacillus sp. ISL-41]
MLPGITLEKASAEERSIVEDLVIYENMPEAEAAVKDGKIQLKALHVYSEGHFMLTAENLVWESANENVAKVDHDGNVDFTGLNGKAFITVTDGAFEDKIALHYKVKPSSKSEGKPEAEVVVIKQEGQRYDLIGKAISKMTIQEKTGQMLMPDFKTWKGKNVTEMLPGIQRLVKKYHLGGVILFRENVVTTEQSARLVSDYQEAAEKFGLLLTIDQEGGIITRLQSGTDMPGSMAIGATRSPEVAYNAGNAIGEELASLGINMNLAPVMDVNNNPDNPVIGVRSFGEDPELVADMGIAYTKGLQAAGVAATAKHFPGHGDTAVDSHLGLPKVPHDKERLKEVELYPFQKGMEEGLDAIMTAHVTFPEIDGTKAVSQKTGEEIAIPATLSYKVLTELMREEMGYEGVITTDAMNMKAIADHFGPVDAAISAVKAGTDIVLMPVGLEKVAAGLLKAVKTGEISEQRVEESVRRILTLKVKRGVIKKEASITVQDKIANAVKVVGSDEHKQIEKEAAEKSITLVKKDAGMPLKMNSSEKVVVVGNTFIRQLGDEIKKRHRNTIVIAASTFKLTENQLKQIKSASAVIVSTYTYNVSGRKPSSTQMTLVKQIIEMSDAPVIGVGIQNPYDIMAYPEIDAYMTQYGFHPSAFEAAAGVLFGEFAPAGKLPVTIPDYNGGVLYEFGHGLTY